MSLRTPLPPGVLLLSLRLLVHPPPQFQFPFLISRLAHPGVRLIPLMVPFSTISILPGCFSAQTPLP